MWLSKGVNLIGFESLVDIFSPFSSHSPYLPALDRRHRSQAPEGCTAVLNVERDTL